MSSAFPAKPLVTPQNADGGANAITTTVQKKIIVAAKSAVVVVVVVCTSDFGFSSTTTHLTRHAPLGRGRH